MHGFFNLSVMSRSKSRSKQRFQVTGKPFKHLIPASTGVDGEVVKHAAPLRARRRRDGLTEEEMNK